MSHGKPIEAVQRHTALGLQLALIFATFASATFVHYAVGLRGWRVLYESLAVFGFGGDLTIGEGSPLLGAVWLVRCAAPLALTATVLHTIWRALRELAVPAMNEAPSDWSGHTVVIGAGRIGQHLCDWSRTHGRRVTAIEHDPLAPSIEQLRAAGIPVIVGDARDRHVLARAGVERAKDLFAVAHNDMVNLSATLVSLSLAKAAHNDELIGFTQITDGRLAEEIEDRLAEEYKGRLEAFSSYDVAADAVMDSRPDSFDSGLVVIAGFGRFGQATLGAILGGDWKGSPPRVLVADKRELGSAADWWREYLPAKPAVGGGITTDWSVEVSCMDVRGPGLEVELRKQLDVHGKLWFLICTDDDNANLSLALRVARLDLSPQIHLFTRMFQWPSALSAAGFEGIRAVNLSDAVNERLPVLLEASRGGGRVVSS
jgi:hypothetical protein